MTWTKRQITVLQDDIDNGVPGKAGQCAIARAVKRELMGLDPGAATGTVNVSYRSLSYGRRHGNRTYLAEAELPEEAAQFVKWFDDGWSVEPFKFEVDEYCTGPDGTEVDIQAYNS